MSDGLVDTNVFLHAISRDSHADECRRFLALVQHGQVRVRLDPLVLHELSYALPRLGQHRTRLDVGRFLLSVLNWPGILGDKDVLTDAVERWQAKDGLGFVDAYLAALADRDNCPIYTKNIRHFEGQGVDAPQTLPSSR